MANKNLFKSAGGFTVPTTTFRNEAGGLAYAMGDELALATYAMTGTFNNTYYTKGHQQLENTLKYLARCSPRFIGQLAVYAREQGFMKDMPALLCAHLTTRGDEGRAVLKTVFNRVMDNGKMLRNFVQIMRSGTLGRKSLGTFPKKLVQEWLRTRDSNYLFRQSVGNNPSMKDILKMVHPRPTSAEQAALFGYLIGEDVKGDPDLPQLIKQFEEWKQTNSIEMPQVDFRMLTGQQLTPEQWREIARTAPWHMTRMNLNTFKRHGVLEDSEMVDVVAHRLGDRDIVRKVKVFPYQIMAAYKAASQEMPAKIVRSLHEALEASVENVPEIPGNVWVIPDVSGSMSQAVTGTDAWHCPVTSVSCIDVAALVAATIQRKNPDAHILPVDTRVHNVNNIDPFDTIMTNAAKLAKFGGGGTDLAAGLKHLNHTNAKADIIIFVSDNESWVDTRPFDFYERRGTALMDQFKALKVRNKKAKMVCVDIQPNASTQATDCKDVLNIGGWSDQVFTVVSNWIKDDKSHWVDQIKEIEI